MTTSPNAPLNLTIKHHTVVMFVAPSCTGKSTLSKMITAQAKAAGVDSVTISSDAIRRELLGFDEDANVRTDEAQLVDKEAFELLFKRFTESITYPVNIPLVILDTTGLTESFRSAVAELCVKYHYTLQVVVLNPNRTGILNSMAANELEYHQPIYLLHYQRLISSTILKQKGIFLITKNVRDEDFVLNVKFPDLPMYTKCRVDLSNPDKVIVIIGDVHERILELASLIARVKFKYPNAVIYLLGDFIDKGGNTLATIDYLLEHPEIEIVIGNHDSYVKGVLSSDRFSRAPLEVEQEYFTSVEVLLGNEEYTTKFLKVMERVIPYLWVTTPSEVVIATHAPCPIKYLGKHDNESQKNQRNKRFNREKSTLDQLDYVFAESLKHPGTYLFGHVMVNYLNNYHNKIMGIDSGAYLGNPLTAFILMADGMTDLIHQKSILPADPKVLINFTP